MDSEMILFMKDRIGPGGQRDRIGQQDIDKAAGEFGIEFYDDRVGLFSPADEQIHDRSRGFDDLPDQIQKIQGQDRGIGNNGRVCRRSPSQDPHGKK